MLDGSDHLHCKKFIEKEGREVDAWNEYTNKINDTKRRREREE